MRCKALKKENLIDSRWDNEKRTLMYRIKKDYYKKILADWVKKENLWIKDET